MEYKAFVVRAFEREPGKWRASVRRPNGRPLRASSRRKLDEFVTAFDAPNASAAMLMAMTAIDSGVFSRRAAPAAQSLPQQKISVEKFWRLTGRLPDTPTSGDQSAAPIQRTARITRSRARQRSRTSHEA
jgi:hypothetical protein